MLEEEIVNTFVNKLPVGGYITSMDVALSNYKILATLFKESLGGRMWNIERLDQFMQYKIRSLIDSATNSGRFNGFTITNEWIGPVVVDGRGHKRKFRAWVKKERRGR